MAQRNKHISISRELAGKLFPLALIICLAITLMVPGAYCYLEFYRLKKETGLYSRQLADSIRQLAAGSPILWKYQSTKYSEIIESFIPNKKILSIAVLDEQSNPINQFSRTENTRGLFRQFGINGEPVQIIFNNKKIGEIQIRLAAESFLIPALILCIACLVTGVSLSVLIYRMPISVVKRLERRVLERTRELESQVIAKEQALAELAAAQSSLVEMSRAAGMAEVATGVLHNVGNVLNSVNVSCNLIMNQVRESRVTNIAKLADLMAESGNSLGRFLTEDPRGRQIPAYLISLSPVLKEEQQLILKETEALHQRIEHIKEIVTMQQTYGRVSGVLETIAPEQLMEDALKLNAGALTRHEITILRQYQEAPPITVDKHKVLQILLNLINNAKYACAGMEKEKIITLQIFPFSPDRLSMRVSDNGMGILPENMTRIFQHGFSTRKAGHGFGLHSGAIAAKELGGRLTAHSDGPGLGATFTLELPFLSGDKA